ncbi:unnamed protein product [Protopolystoma xenopodis]|uniref:Uncharacterized protein n=1 Tax=Protopolystoma xenopodis TaxID=117903 RepID=A0A448XJ01_9PLAT|nr:unnamed protein product [Protopolystoma xenopodis]
MPLDQFQTYVVSLLNSSLVKYVGLNSTDGDSLVWLFLQGSRYPIAEGLKCAISLAFCVTPERIMRSLTVMLT